MFVNKRDDYVGIELEDEIDKEQLIEIFDTYYDVFRIHGWITDSKIDSLRAVALHLSNDLKSTRSNGVGVQG